MTEPPAPWWGRRVTASPEQRGPAGRRPLRRVLARPRPLRVGHRRVPFVADTTSHLDGEGRRAAASPPGPRPARQRARASAAPRRRRPRRRGARRAPRRTRRRHARPRAPAIKTPEPEGTDPVRWASGRRRANELTQRRPRPVGPAPPGPTPSSTSRPSSRQARTDGAPPITRRRRRWPWIVVAVVVVLAALGGGLYAAAKNKVFTASTRAHPGRQTLTSAGRWSRRTTSRSSNARRLLDDGCGRVVEHQSPDPRTSLKRAARLPSPPRGAPTGHRPVPHRLRLRRRQKVLALVNLTGQCLSPTYSSTVRPARSSTGRTTTCSTPPRRRTTRRAHGHLERPRPRPDPSWRARPTPGTTTSTRRASRAATQQTRPRWPPASHRHQSRSGRRRPEGTSVTVLISEARPS